MSKVKTLVIIFFALIGFLRFPSIANAAPSISTIIGDINPGQDIPITVTGLDSNKTYVWEIKKYTNVIHFSGSDPYSPISKNCFNSDSSKQIIQTIGPFSSPGYYSLRIFRGDTSSGNCISSGNHIVHQDFSVGGPVGGSTSRDLGKECCYDTNLTDYDRNKDICRQGVVHYNPFSPKNEPTKCSKSTPKSFCEPDSITCFSTKTFVVQGKICMDQNDPNFKKDKNIVCASSGGLTATGCTDDPNNPGIATAIGCIHTNPTALVKDFMKFGVGIGGGLAFLMMLLGAFQMLTSAGNPETLNAGKERLTSAVIGLLIVIFAVLLLKIIGVDILGLGGQFGY